jgi:hypothetical protein
MQYDFAVGANGGQRIEVSGRFFKYASGAGKIRVTTSRGGYVDLVPGQGIFGGEFSGLSITDRSGVANSGVILAGDFDFRDERIPGTVLTADGSSGLTMTQQCFVGSQAASIGTDSNFAILTNAAGSGVNVVVTRLGYCGVSGQGLGLYQKAGHVAVVSPNTVQARNKKIGGPMSLAKLSNESLNGAALTALGVPLVQQYIEGGKYFVIEFKENIVVPPGFALLAGDWQSTGQQKYITYEFREDPL